MGAAEGVMSLLYNRPPFLPTIHRAKIAGEEGCDGAAGFLGDVDVDVGGSWWAAAASFAMLNATERYRATVLPCYRATVLPCYR